MAITIITLIIALLSLGLSLSVLREGRKAAKELDAIIEDIKSQPVPDSPAVKVDGIDIMSYDKARKTVVVKGNIEAEGWIAAGEIIAK